MGQRVHICLQSLLEGAAETCTDNTAKTKQRREYILARHVNLAQISVCCIWGLGPCQALTSSKQPIQSFAHRIPIRPRPFRNEGV